MIGWRSDAQALAPLGTTGINHSATATGLHTGPKTVGPCALDFRGLVGAFHGYCRVFRKALD